MFGRILSLMFVFVIVILNFLFLLTPIIVLVSPFLNLEIILHHQALIERIFFLIVFFVSFLTILYFLLDCILGFTVSFYGFKYKKYSSSSEYYKLIEPCVKEVKERFRLSFVSVLIERSNTINAFAVGSMRKKVVIFTKALLDTIKAKAGSDEEFSLAIKAILAHEMSHLANSDYLPGLLLRTNDVVTRFVSRLIGLVITIVFYPVRFIPIFGSRLLLIPKYSIFTVAWILNFVNYKIFRNIYSFVNIYITRSIEYRADMDSARAFGGNGISLALSFIGNGYNSIFSSHPSIQNRIKTVQVVQPEDDGVVIRPSLGMEIVNSFAVVSFFALCLYCAKKAEIWQLFDHIKQIYFSSETKFIKMFILLQTKFFK